MNTGFLGPAVAIVLTVYGIETRHRLVFWVEKIVAIVLTVYGIETIKHHKQYDNQLHVAIVLTVYGIETQFRNCFIFDYSMLQQCLPFTVLKPIVSFDCSFGY